MEVTGGLDAHIWFILSPLLEAATHRDFCPLWSSLYLTQSGVNRHTGRNPGASCGTASLSAPGSPVAMSSVCPIPTGPWTGLEVGCRSVPMYAAIS